MKKQFIAKLGTVTRISIVRLGLASLLLLNFVPTFVNAQDDVRTLASAIAVKYLGNIEDQPVFQIEFDNKNEETFNLTIKDDEGNLLYVERSRDKKYSKKFKLAEEYRGNVKLTFTVSTDKERQSQVFEVNSNTRVIQDVVVTKL